MTTPLSVSPDILMAQTPAASTADLARRHRIADTARKFEASFLASMLKPMFDGLSTDAPFGGGEGEAMFKSFMTDAIAAQTAKRGGLGVGDLVQREMLKLQGLS